MLVSVKPARRATITLVNLNLIRVPAIAPYAIDALASALEDEGHDVEVLDLCREADPYAAIGNYFSTRHPDLVALSMRNACDLYFPSYFHLETRGSFLQSHRRLIDTLKEYVEEDRILIGGVGFSMNPVRFLRRLGLRYGVKGPGEGVIATIAREPDGAGLSRLAGGAHCFVFDGRSAGGSRAVRRTYVNNRWYYDTGGQAAVRTSAGCVMHCGYCAEPGAVGRSYHRSTIENIMREIDQLVSAGIHDIQTADSEFNMPIAHSKDVLRAMVERQYGKDLRLWLYCQPRPFDREYAELLAKAGVMGVNFGTDHTDAGMLQALGKWYSKEDVAQASALCRDYGVEVMHELLFGYPGDTPDKMFRAIDDIQRLQPRVIGVSIGLAVVPDTPLGSLLEEKMKSGAPGPGFYLAGESMVDPTFFVDPAFTIPDVFAGLERRIGRDARNIMLPTLNSTGSQNNQLVDSERVRRQTLIEKRKGPPWYHYPDNPQ